MESVSNRGIKLRNAERKEKGSSAKECLDLTLMGENKWRKRETMEALVNIHDLVVVIALIAIVMTPRAIETYLAVRK